MTTKTALRQIARTTDEALAPLLAKRDNLMAEVAGLKKILARAVARNDEAGIARREDEISETMAEASAVLVESAPLREIANAGSWSRFIYVPGGHVHRLTCSTLRATTSRMWLTEYSGADEAEVVEAAGDVACTVCFPSAPLGRRSTVAVVVKEREEREAEAAAKLDARAAKAAAAIVTDEGKVAFKTRRAAENALGESLKSAVYFGTYAPEVFDGRNTYPNPETAETYFARMASLVEDELAGARAVVELLTANGVPAAEVAAIAERKLTAATKAAKKAGFVVATISL